MYKLKIFVRKFSTCIGVIWLGGRFIPMNLVQYFDISILSDRDVLRCGIFLMIYIVMTKGLGNKADEF